MKKRGLLAIFFSFILFLAACGGEETSGENGEEADGGLIGGPP